MNDHIADQDLAAYVDGALPGAPRAELESHLSRCPECLAALAEIVDIQGSAVKIPADFLRQALGEKASPAKAAPPMRLVLGIAAVFLVVVLIGYFFLDRGREETAGIVEKEMAQPAAPAAAHPTPSPDAVAGKTRKGSAAGALADLESKDKAVSGWPREKKSAFPAPAGGKTAAPAALPEKAERQRPADEMDMAPPREAEGGAVGGVLGGVEAQPAPDKENVTRLAAAAAPGARAEEFAKSDGGILRQAEAAVRSRGAGPEGGLAPRPRFPGAGAPADARQLFLAVSGHAAAPPAVEIAHPATRPLIRIAGDVSLADLSDPGLLDSWSWFPKGGALRLEIDPSGAVVAVVPVGPWGEAAAARALAAARELRFPASGKKSRRAVLSDSAPPN